MGPVFAALTINSVTKIDRSPSSGCDDFFS